MTRALDHIVWPARDLAALATLFRTLGFTVGRRNRHPWGTVNHIIQFDGAFLELLGFAEDYRSLEEADPAFPFASFCERFLAKAEAGAAMLVLRSDDAVADAGVLAQQGLGHGRLLPFSRSAQGPDGSDRTVAFTVAFADLPGLTGLGAFLCEQHRPENFWDEAAQRHANGASGIAGLVFAGPDPVDHTQTLRRFAQDGSDSAFPQVVLAGGCRLTLCQATRDEKAAITSLEIRVADLSTMATGLAGAGLEPAIDGDALAVESPILGATRLVFRQHQRPKRIAS